MTEEPKKKGRPKKIQTVENELSEKKKRGRKKKEKTEEEEETSKEKKKRGRKATLKFFSSSIRKKMPLVFNIQDSDKYICHLDISEKDLLNSQDNTDLFSEYIESNDSSIDIFNLYEKRIENRIKEDNEILEIDTSKEIEKELKTNSYVYMSKYIPLNDWKEKVDICCWWCCHKFETVPLGTPIYYDSSSDKFRTRGVFCSFSCMIAHDQLEYKYKNKYLIKCLYTKLTGGREITDKTNFINSLKKNAPTIYKDDYIDTITSFIDSNLEPAPPRYALKMFGGNLDITQFRNATKERRVYRMVKYPMYISRDYIEEVDIGNLKEANKKLFSKQEHLPKNLLDSSKVQDLKKKMKDTVIISNNSIDKFINIT
jgi:hypothetical protein